MHFAMYRNSIIVHFTASMCLFSNNPGSCGTSGLPFIKLYPVPRYSNIVPVTFSTIQDNLYSLTIDIRNKINALIDSNLLHMNVKVAIRYTH